MTRQRPRALLNTRSTVILLLSFLVAVAASGLTYLSGHSVPEALIVAGIATGGSLGLFSSIIE